MGETYLLHTAGKQHPVLAIDPLHHHAPPIARPRALHLGKHPLVDLGGLWLVEVDAVVEADQHPQPGPILPVFHPGAHAFKLGRGLDLLALLLGEVGDVLGRVGEAPEAVDAADGADEVAVRHVRQRVEVGLVSALCGDLAPRPHPLSALLLIRLRRLVLAPKHLNLGPLKRPVPRPLGLPVPVLGRRAHAVGQRRRVAHLLVPAAAFLDEADGGREDAPPLLPRLHGARGKGAAVAHALDVEEDGDLVGAGEQKVAVARVHEEVLRDRLLGGGEGLRDDDAAEDAAGAGRVPWLTSVCEDVLKID